MIRSCVTVALVVTVVVGYLPMHPLGNSAVSPLRGSQRGSPFSAPSFLPSSRSAASSSSASRCSSVLQSSSTVADSESVSTSADSAESFSFTSDVRRTMEIIINSLYSDRSVFLRELVSNAADACDKKRFLSLSKEGDDEEEMGIRIKVKKSADADGSGSPTTITIEDNGVGMTKDELINNLGQIAMSGTKAFSEAMKTSDGDSDSLIGQFGVGFYSAFLVADRVSVETKGMESDEWLKWESNAYDGYTITALDTPPEDFVGSSGSRLTLFLKEDAVPEFQDADSLSNLATKYSEFVQFPISVYNTKTTYDRVVDEEKTKEKRDKLMEEKALSEEEADKELGEDGKVMKTEPTTTEGFMPIGNKKPVWLRPPKEVSDEEYTDFYKSAFRAYDEPMKKNHFVLEGQVECKSILYIPSMLPYELSKNMFDEEMSSLKLYVKRVFINDNFEGLIPRYLKFVRGVVDSDDLPLNVGREILQKSRMLTVINKSLVKKSLAMVREISEDKDQYAKFWTNFGKYIKVGVIEDEANKDELAELTRWFSTISDTASRSFADYVSDIKEKPEEGKEGKIYYVSGDGFKAAAMSPALENLKKNGVEVLYMTEPLDEIAIQSVKMYKAADGKEYELVDATKADVQLDGADEEKVKEKKEAAEKDLKGLKEFLEEAFKGKVEKVEISTRLSDSPATLVQGMYGMSPSMQKYMQAQAVAMGEEESMQGMMGNMNQVIMEINPDHEIIKTLDAIEEEDDKKEFANLVYDVAAMSSGYTIDDPQEFTKRVLKLMAENGKGGGAAAVQDAEMA